MYNYFKGKIEEIGDTYVVIDVNGVGYELTCSDITKQSLSLHTEAKVYAYYSVSENNVGLFGFSSKEEKSLFLHLISVSGVGPKSAVQILSGASLDHIVYCIASNDAKSLSKIKGLGKKTAEKIIVELKDKLGAGFEVGDNSTVNMPISKDNDEAVMALMSLGFTRNEAQEGVKKAISAGADTLESIISIAIKRML